MIISILGWGLVALVCLVGAMLWSRRQTYQEVRWLIKTAGAWHDVETRSVQIHLHWCWPFCREIGFGVMMPDDTDGDVVQRVLRDINRQLDERYGDEED